MLRWLPFASEGSYFLAPSDACMAWQSTFWAVPWGCPASGSAGHALLLQALILPLSCHALPSCHPVPLFVQRLVSHTYRYTGTVPWRSIKLSIRRELCLKFLPWFVCIV